MTYKSHSSEFKYEGIMAHKNEAYTQKELCSKYQINKITLYRWINKYKVIAN